MRFKMLGSHHKIEQMLALPTQLTSSHSQQYNLPLTIHHVHIAALKIGAVAEAKVERRFVLTRRIALR